MEQYMRVSLLNALEVFQGRLFAQVVDRVAVVNVIVGVVAVSGILSSGNLGKPNIK
jgi:hypothetical protein